MKKISLILLILVMAVGLIVFQQKDQGKLIMTHSRDGFIQKVKSAFNITSSQSKKIPIPVKDFKDVKNPYGKNLVSFWGDPISQSIIYPIGTSVINLLEANHEYTSEIQEKSQLIMQELVECLTKDNLCRQKEDEFTGYFDDENSPLHMVLEQSLDVLSHSIELDGVHVDIKVNLLERLLGLSHEGIQNKAMILLFNQGYGDNVKTIAPHLEGSVKQNFLKHANKHFSVDEFEEYLLQSLSEDDFITNIHVINALGNMKVSDNTARKVLKSICFVRRQPANTQNIIFEQKIKTWSEGYNLSFVDECR